MQGGGDERQAVLRYLRRLRHRLLPHEQAVADRIVAWIHLRGDRFNRRAGGFQTHKKRRPAR